MLKTNYQILENTIRNEDLYIKLSGRSGKYGCRQLEVLSFTDPMSDPDNIPSWFYAGDIYGSLSELLDFAEEDIKIGKQFRNSEGRCHRCMEPNFEGENNLETWLILGGDLFLYSREGKINIEARGGALHQYKDVYFTLNSESLGKGLQELDDVMNQYDLAKFREFLESDVVSNEEEIQRQLKLVKK